MIYVTCVLLGLIVGFVIGFVMALLGQYDLEKRYAKDGVAKIYGSYYRIEKIR